MNKSKVNILNGFWRLSEDIPKPLYITLTISSIALPLFLWWFITTVGNIDPKFLPSPANVLQAFGRLWSSGELMQDTIASLWRVGVGFFSLPLYSPFPSAF